MDSLLLSRLTKDFLNEDLDLIPGRERYRMGWAGSVLASHPAAPKDRQEAVAVLLALRERVAGLFKQGEAPAVFLSTAPQLPKPIVPPTATFRPPWYFSRGALEADKRKNPEPIPYLLTETNEKALARPVPGNSLLIRSLCKGKGVLRRNSQGLVYLDVDNRFISMLLPYLKSYGLVRPPYLKNSFLKEGDSPLRYRAASSMPHLTDSSVYSAVNGRDCASSCPFNLFDAPEGAHVPVIPAREAAFHYLDQIEQLDREFSFEIEGLYSMEPISWPEVEQVWFFKLRSTELEDLRRRYFLPALPGGHSFHIAVAVKPRITATDTPRPLPIMRINTAFIAA